MSELLSSENSGFIFTSNCHDLKWIIWSWRYSEVKKLLNIYYFCYCVGNMMPEAKILFLHSSQRSGEGGSLQMCTSITLDYFPLLLRSLHSPWVIGNGRIISPSLLGKTRSFSIFLSNHLSWHTVVPYTIILHFTLIKVFHPLFLNIEILSNYLASF